MINKTLSNIFKGDKGIWMVFFFLCIVSIIEVYSASSMLTYKGSYIAPIMKHIGLLLVGVVFMVVTSNFNCGYFKFLTPFALGFSLITLALVLITGATTNGASRWFDICGIQFQPSEVAKGSLVLATAQILSALQTEDGADKKAFKYILFICMFIIPLIMVENLSTAMLLCMVIVMMMFIGRVPIKQLSGLIASAIIALIVVVSLVMLLGKDPAEQQPESKVLTEQVEKQEPKSKGIFDRVFHRFDTWKGRIDKFINKEEIAPDEVDLIDNSAQENYAKVAIATSNVVGKGPGSSEACDFLSQAFSDFIYAIIIEEMGIVGAFGVAMLYIILLFRTGRIANRCENNFPAFLAMGLALLLVTQALFNMMVAVGLAPVTGQPLPLISKGGTSSIINCVYIGVILSISRSAKRKQETIIEQTSAETAETFATEDLVADRS